MRIWIFLLSLSISICCNGKNSELDYALSEHLAAGNSVVLHFNALNPPESKARLTLPNGLKLTFGEILSLGDLYGVLGQPVTLGKTTHEQQKRFLAAFNTFAKDVDVKKEVMQLLAVISKELKMVRQGMEKGENPETVYQKIGMEIGREVNCITGGGCNDSLWWLQPGRYLKLAEENFDHFAPNAALAYTRGHIMAQKQAIKARNSRLREDLELAYAMDAFACHFLSDYFASGHLRTPRLKLADIVTPSIVGSVLASYMHNEENKYGVHVHNYKFHWKMFGDFAYFSDNNRMTRQIVEKLLQQSADSIFAAYYTGYQQNIYHILDNLPTADEAKAESSIDITPMFYYDNKTGKLLRRKDLADPYAKEMTDNWWGWSTLLKLQELYGANFEMRAFLQKQK